MAQLDQHRASHQARRDAGRARREAVPFEAHAEIGADAGRDPLATLAAQDQDRVQDLVPIRYGRMAATSFTFFRGAAAVQAADLAGTARTDLTAQLCGDAHLSNFGIFRSPDRSLVFDVNDFDETHPGPFEWDLKRLAASVAVAARDIGLSSDDADAATRGAVKGYRKAIAEAADMSPLDLYYHRIDVHDLLARTKKGKARKRADKAVRKAGGKDSLRALRKLTDIVDGRRVIVADPPLVTPLDAIGDETGRSQLAEFLGRARASLPLDRRVLLDRFTFVDAAWKVVGVGSVGTRCAIVLLETGDGVPLFLQFKEATTSVLEPHLGASAFKLAGRRVVEGQRLIQSAPDVFLGWARWDKATTTSSGTVDFYFRQLWDGKGSADVATLGPRGLRAYARMCGGTLALAHARSGDASMICGYVGDDSGFDRALARYARAYADRNEADHGLVTAAIRDGSIEAVNDL